MLACSRPAAEWLFGKENINNVDIIYNGINLSKYYYNSNSRSILREKYNIDNNCILLGHVGRFVYVKNHTFLIDLIDVISKEKNNYKLMLVGDGELKEKIKNNENEKKLSDNVIFVDSNSNVNEYYSAFDLFLFPSKFEGLGIVLIEAQSSGLKCIVSDAIPCEAIVSKNVDVCPLSVDIWIDKILSCEVNEVDRKNQKYDDSIKAYDIKITSDTITKIYFNLLKDGD